MYVHAMPKLDLYLIVQGGWHLSCILYIKITICSSFITNYRNFTFTVHTCNSECLRLSENMFFFSGNDMQMYWPTTDVIGTSIDWGRSYKPTTAKHNHPGALIGWQQHITLVRHYMSQNVCYFCIHISHQHSISNNCNESVIQANHKWHTLFRDWLMSIETQ